MYFKLKNYVSRLHFKIRRLIVHCGDFYKIASVFYNKTLEPPQRHPTMNIREAAMSTPQEESP